ncbi:MAG: AAA family ATPase [Symploca sp. SIO1C2]|nr:AAA family ATPase [Symploca sp. SIO1C2]
MLVQVTIENFLSFKEAITLSMLGENNDLNHVEHLAVDAAGKGKSVLPIAAIYGANAAGKSNLIDAIDFAKDLIIEGTRSGQVIPVSTFKLGDYSKKPSSFEFIFTYEDACYFYGFELNAKRICEEWLYGIPPNKKRKVLYFERTTSEQEKTAVEFGAILRGRKSTNQQFLDFIAQGTRPNQLFLTEAVDRNVKKLQPVVNWFKKVLTIIPAESHYSGLEFGILGSNEFTKFLNNFLKLSGTGIDSIGMDEIQLDFDYHFPEIPVSMREDIEQQLAEAVENSVLMIESITAKRYLLIKGEDQQINIMQLKTKHRNEKGQLVDFSIDEESEGTQRLINLIPALFILQQKPEKVIFIDELDRRLHPLLSRQFLELSLHYQAKESISQLIFTTHDTNLLDLDLLRRDEIWFVEKNQKGASDLYPLAEFKIRPDLKIEKGYLNGRFGAIPFFGDIRSLGWLDSETEPSTNAVEV